jgi:glucokinase
MWADIAGAVAIIVGAGIGIGIAHLLTKDSW